MAKLAPIVTKILQLHGFLGHHLLWPRPLTPKYNQHIYEPKYICDRPKLGEIIFIGFYCTSSYASAVLAVVYLSVCPSVRPSVHHRHLLWQNQTIQCGYFDTTRKGNHSTFVTPTLVGGRRPLPFEICALSEPPPSRNADFDRFPLITSQP